ncbi:MAG TPA: PmoA family protein [Draconibacterium sp.]|nr:PmoA family protein [Draconibacterium sp.]
MKILYLTAAAIILSAGLSLAAKTEKVEFKNNPQDKKVEVYIGGKYFTSYIYPDNMEKQTLWPIVTASGKTITRGYPLAPRPFERTDHPHHVGLWFNFGDVNGLDFWNNSFAIKPKDKPKYGSIKFKKIVSEDPKKGKLVTLADWVDHEGNVLLNEETTYLFSGEGNLRTIERVTKLTAAQKVTFNQCKEGIIGMRLDRAFEEPSKKPERFLDANGNVTKVPVMNNEGVNGVYHNADGVTGTDVWGKRSPWVALRATKEGEVITIVLMDNKHNINYPAWSHARGYGLFAANNIGGQPFDKNADPVKVVLEPGQTITFKHEVVIGGDLTDDQINAMAKKFK